MATSSSTNSMEKQGPSAHAAADEGSAQKLPPGDGESSDLPRVLGRYILLRRIARGGMGEVFLGSTTGLEGAERPVVVKIIRREHATDPSFIARFLDEARVQAQLQHSGVAQVIEADTDERTGEPYAIVEHVEGRSLGDVRARALQIGHRVGWSEAVGVGTMIADALAHVHERKDPSGRPLAIVHRDLSPQNVMLSFQGEVKIIDFGTARGQNRRCRTVSGVVFAKPGYVAPEVANGDTGDARVDLYALGVMLWELCAGRRFLQGDAGAHMANVARNQCSPPPVAAAAGAPVELDAIIAKLTAFDREARYGESRAVARDLAKLLGSAPALPSGERGVRARAAHLMQSLFPFEPERSRREFARLIIAASPLRKSMAAPPSRGPEERPAASSGAPSAGHEKGSPSVEPGGDPSLLPGTRYRLLREIGRGASSVVYEAEHVDLGRRVALKVLAAEHTGVREFASRFRREARAMSRLSHENLVKIIDFGLAGDGRLFCVMELLEGETLEELLQREKSVAWEKALTIAKKALRALEVAHAASVIHRDIKPANLFLTKAGGLKLLDFGLAKAPDKGLAEGPSAAPEEVELTKRPGLTILGTPEYMAPEQASSGQGDARSDIYAVGSVVYEMLTGSLPFTGSSPVALLAAKIKAMPERPKERCPGKDIPRAADEIVMRAMARHPSLRFQSACEMRQAIEKVLDAPAALRLRRRVAGLSIIAATMAFAAVLLVGRASEIRSAAGRLIASPTAADVTAAADVKAADPVEPAAPDPVEPSEAQAAMAPVEADPVQIGPEPPAGDSASNAEGSAASEATDSDQDEDPTGEAAKKAAVAQAAPRKARPRQHSKPAGRADEKATSAASKGSPEGALAKAPAAPSGSKEAEKTSKPSGDGATAKEPTKGAEKPEDKVASHPKDAAGAAEEPASPGSTAPSKSADQTAKKGSPAKPSRKDVPPNRRKKKTRLAKKGE
jgi:serine/threonine-protein kinase